MIQTFSIELKYIPAQAFIICDRAILHKYRRQMIEYLNLGHWNFLKGGAWNLEIKLSG